MVPYVSCSAFILTLKCVNVPKWWFWWGRVSGLFNWSSFGSKYITGSNKTELKNHSINHLTNFLCNLCNLTAIYFKCKILLLWFYATWLFLCLYRNTIDHISFDSFFLKFGILKHSILPWIQSKITLSG